MEDCIFCKIRDGVIKSKIHYEDEKMFIISDISPRARLHYLMIPKKHFKSLIQMSEQDCIDLGESMKKVGELAPSLGLENGFRLTINQGEDAIQTVFHLHVHIMGGEKLPV